MLQPCIRVPLHSLITRKMVPIKGRASSLLEIILYAQIRGLKYQKQNRMEEETELQT